MKVGTKHHMAELLLAGDTKAAAAAHCLSDAGSWDEVLALAQTWKVIPQLAARIQSLQVTLSLETTRILRQEILRAYGQSTSRAARTIAAIRELEQVGIRVVTFKGVASMALLYGGPRHRTVGDGDLLILRKDLPSALVCLETRGFVRRGEETLGQYLSFVENAPRFAGNEAICLYGDDASEIDVHWDVAGSGLRVEEILERSARATLMESAIPVVDTGDGFLLTVHHAIREDLGIESVCRDLLDARLWCQHLEETGRLAAAMKRVGESRSLVGALAVTGILRGYDGAAASARAYDLLRRSASRAQRQSAVTLTELFQYQIEHGRLGKDVLYLVHSRPWRQIVRGLITDWKGYRSSMRTMESSLREEQPLFRRFAQLAGSVPGPQGLRLARELARVKYR